METALGLIFLILSAIGFLTILTKLTDWIISWIDKRKQKKIKRAFESIFDDYISSTLFTYPNWTLEPLEYKKIKIRPKYHREPFGSYGRTL